MKSIYNKNTANSEKFKEFPIRLGVRQDSHTYQYSSQLLATAVRQEKEIQTGKGDVELSLFSDDLILYLRHPKDAIKKLLEIIIEFSKVSVYKINICYLPTC